MHKASVYASQTAMEGRYVLLLPGSLYDRFSAGITTLSESITFTSPNGLVSRQMDIHGCVLYNVLTIPAQQPGYSAHTLPRSSAVRPQ